MNTNSNFKIILFLFSLFLILSSCGAGEKLKSMRKPVDLAKTPLDPDETFSEDPLRMIRAAYFISKLGFKIDNNCLISIRRQAFRIDIVSWERIRDEFIKILRTDVLI